MSICASLDATLEEFSSMNLLLMLTGWNFLEGTVVPPVAVCGVVPVANVSMTGSDEANWKINCSPSFPCSAVLERSDSAGVKAVGGLAGELVDDSATPFVITLSCN